MNRRDRDTRRKQKREQKRRDARAHALGSPAAAARESAPSDGLLQLSSRIVKALAGEKTRAASVDAAALGAELLEKTLETAWDRTELVPACEKGCSYCCRGFRVDVTLPEVARLAAFVEKRLAPATAAGVKERAQRNAPLTHGQTMLGYPSAVACALLSEEGECLAYAARPLACRKQHALDAEQCKQAFEHDYAPGFLIEQAKIATNAGAQAYAAYLYALSNAGWDDSVYELQEALHIALSRPDAFEAWLAGDPVFDAALANRSSPAGVEDTSMRLVQLQAKPGSR